VRAAARSLLGAAVGLVLGVMTAVGLLVANARLRGRYLSSPDDALGWAALPLLAGPALGVWLGLRRSALGRRIAVRAAWGMTAGIALGAAIGGAIDRHEASAWAGGVIGGTAGILIGAALGWVPPRGEGATSGGRTDPG